MRCAADSGEENRTSQWVMYSDGREVPARFVVVSQLGNKASPDIAAAKVQPRHRGSLAIVRYVPSKFDWPQSVPFGN